MEDHKFLANLIPCERAELIELIMVQRKMIDIIMYLTSDLKFEFRKNAKFITTLFDDITNYELVE